LTFFSNAFSDFEKDRGDAMAREFRQLSHITDRQIKREVANQETEIAPSNFSTADNSGLALAFE
jgi:hypothetical protein